ncbi:MAG TPA: PHB depolymerase family esterase [Albitalea sp.]|uniref:carboxylesterase family protein n=1 Tax=Piscinibacter sp. TaxID=1903157 RepID=UPI002ED0A4A2
MIEHPSVAARQVERSFASSDGTTIRYWEYLPEGYAGGIGTYPLLVFFHGAGESGPADGSRLDAVKLHGPPRHIEAGHDMCFDTPGGRECFIVVSPQNSRGWWDPRDTAGMLGHALAAYRVDPTRVYVTGMSMGGAATWRLATSTRPGTGTYWAQDIAAIAPVCGAADSRNSHAGISKGIVATGLPVWAFHGDQDTTVDAATSQAWVDKINAQAGNPSARLTLYPGVGHDSWTRTYDPAREVEPGRNLYQWLLAHRRP